MPETSGIHEIINPGGTGSSFSPAYSKVAAKTGAKKSKLKVGEIVPGRVLDVQAQDIAVVSLPEGIFSAVLHSNLRKDDYLYLRVSETEPNLVLKIYSVPSKFEGKDISITDILRILFLPNNIFFNELVSFLKNIRKNILRDEIIKINQFYSNLSDQNKNYKNLSNSFELITFLLDNKIQLSEPHFLFFDPIFSIEKIAKSMAIIERNIIKISDSDSEELDRIFNLMKQPGDQFPFLFELFRFPKNNDRKKDSLYDILLGLSLKTVNNEDLKILNDSLKLLINFIEALHIYNLINIKNKRPVIIMFPIFKDGNYIFIKIRAQRNTKSRKEKVEFEIQTKKFDDVTFNIQNFDDLFEIQIKNESRKFEGLIRDFISSISEALDLKQYKLGLVNIVDSFDNENVVEQEEQKNQAISVVI